MMEEAYTIIDNHRCKIICLLDIDDEETDDLELACSMLYQYEHEIKPEGEPQIFRKIWFESITKCQPQ